MKQKLKKLISRENVTNYEKWFNSIANETLFNTHLLIKGKAFEIIEIEFYVNAPNHPDIFTHPSNDLKSPWAIYFHKTGSSYKEGSYTGMDIVLGNRNRIGGVLIRGLKEVESGKVIEGPSKIVSFILQQFKEIKVRELVKKINMTFDGPDLKLVEVKGEKVKILRTPRVGLTLKRTAAEKVKFLLKDYRYIKYPELTKKGRHWIIASALIHNFPMQKSAHASAKYLAILNKGRNKKINYNHYGHHSKRDDLIELYGALNF